MKAVRVERRNGCLRHFIGDVCFERMSFVKEHGRHAFAIHGLGQTSQMRGTVPRGRLDSADLERGVLSGRKRISLDYSHSIDSEDAFQFCDATDLGKISAVLLRKPLRRSAPKVLDIKAYKTNV